MVENFLTLYAFTMERNRGRPPYTEKPSYIWHSMDRDLRTISTSIDNTSVTGEG